MTVDTVERRVGELTVRIDRLLCVGFADCLDEAPGAFVLDDKGIVAFAEPDLAPRERLLRACEACPVDALSVLDASGRQIVPAQTA
ncbi:MAG TPA: ferredoxin [Gemmatimonadota bacterium]|nr:ferredoxin [Gemmatimonadota bacterium]